MRNPVKPGSNLVGKNDMVRTGTAYSQMTGSSIIATDSFEQTAQLTQGCPGLKEDMVPVSVIQYRSYAFSK